MFVTGVQTCALPIYTGTLARSIQSEAGRTDIVGRRSDRTRIFRKGARSCMWTTEKKEFLGIMEKLIPWSQWVGIVQPHYYKGERGNKPYDLGLMLRIYVLQHLYNLADDAARNEIIDSRAFSQFCGVDSSNQVPDGDTIGRFRHILEQNQLGEAFFTNVVESLQKCNLMLKKGTIVDSTLIAAPSSTKNKIGRASCRERV